MARKSVALLRRRQEFVDEVAVELGLEPVAEQKAKLSFIEFVNLVKPKYKWYRHCLVLAAVLQRVADGELKRAMIFMPPRHGKSELASRLFPAYFLYLYPEKFVGLSSYEAGLAYTFSRAVRDNYLESGCELRSDAGAVDYWLTPQDGGMWAAGVGGPITGKGYHLGLIDDPLKNAKDALSDTIRSSQKDWYDSTFATREEPEGAQVIILTRWHEDDLAGWLLKREENPDDEPEGWHVVSLPAIAEEDAPKFPTTCTVESDWRLPGEALCPERYPLSKLRKFQKNRYFWSALYQQRPTPADGDVFKAAWFKFYGELAENYPLLVLSVDAAFKGSDGSDYVVIQLWGVLYPDFYLVDQSRGKIGYLDTIASIKAMINRWKPLYGEPHVKLIEDKANGSAIIEQLSREFPGVIPVEPEGGKLVRAHAASSFYQSGNVWLPQKHNMSWVADHIDEFISFPKGRHDDQVDAASQFLIYMTENGMLGDCEPVGIVRASFTLRDY